IPISRPCGATSSTRRSCSAAAASTGAPAACRTSAGIRRCGPTQKTAEGGVTRDRDASFGRQMRPFFVPIGIAVACALAVAAIVVASNRPALVLTAPSATTATTITQGILTSGDATVSKKPDLAVVGAGVDAQAPTASAAQSDLNSKAV